MFDAKYDDWNHKRIKAIIDHYGPKFFFKKKILDLGCGQGEIAAAFSRLGADITCVDARQENLDSLKKKFPHIKTICCDLETSWPSNEDYDMVFSLGVLCHLKNYERHLENICIYGEHIILETEVLDSNNPDSLVSIYEDKVVNDKSFGGEGTILSPPNIEKRLTNLGATFKRIDETKLNSHSYRYNWLSSNSEKRDSSNRRMWFVKRDRFLAQQFANNRSIKYAEEEAQRQVAMARSRFPTYAYRQSGHDAPPKQRTAPPYAPTPRVIPPPPIPPPLPPLLISNPVVSPINSQYFIHTAEVSENVDTNTMRLFYIYDDSIKNDNAEFCVQKNLENKELIPFAVKGVSLTYNSIFDKINEVCGPDDINIICTSYIYVDSTIAYAKNIKTKQVYALTCWDLSPDNNAIFRNKADSQSAWVVRGKIENVNGDFVINKLSADSRIAYEFHKAGYKVLNPSESIKVYNIGPKISDGPAIPGPHLFVIPTAFAKKE